MAIATARAVRSNSSQTAIVVPPNFGPFRARARHQFLTTWELRGKWRSRLTRLSLEYAAQPVLDSLGIVNPSKIAAVLDASGFAFSDQWGATPAEELVAKMASRSRKQSHLVLLPQAFGPFTNKSVANATRQLCHRSTLVFARDKVSRNALRELGIDEKKLRLSPDFTLSVPAAMNTECPAPGGEWCAIVPNQRMIDRKADNGVYERFLEHCINAVIHHNVDPVLVVHTERTDRPLAQRLNNKYPTLRVFAHEDPQVLKGWLGSAKFVIASRFHAIVSSLSQLVPCIGTGWSHKYEELYADFNCTTLLIRRLDDMASVDKAIEDVLCETERVKLVSEISAARDNLKAKNAEMWQEVFQVLGSPA